MIDAHHHLWDPRAREYDWLLGDQPWASDEELARLRRAFTLAELAPLAAGAGVTGTVVIQTVNDEWETRDLLALAAGTDPYGNRGGEGGGPGGAVPPGAPVPNLLAGVVGWVDLTAPGVEDAVAQLRVQPGGSFLCGIRHPLMGEPSSWLTQPEVRRGLGALAKEGLCFDVVLLPHQLEATVTALRSVPELCVVLDHMGAPPVDSEGLAGGGAASEAWARVARDLGGLPNVTCKLSGMHSVSVRASTLRPFYDTLLEAFGPDRLMFGSDWPVSSLVAPYGEVCALYQELTADLGADERDAVFDGTARRVYRLSTHPG